MLVRQQTRGAGVDVVGDEVDRARQVLLGVVGLGQGIDEDQRAGVEAGLKLSSAPNAILTGRLT